MASSFFIATADLNATPPRKDEKEIAAGKRALRFHVDYDGGGKILCAVARMSPDKQPDVG